MAPLLAALPLLMASGGLGAAAAGTAVVAGTAATAAATGSAIVFGSTAAAAAAGGLSMSTMLMGGLGLVGGLGAIASGFAEKNQLKAQAAQFDQQAAEELAAGAERARQVAEEARKLQGSQASIFAASGIDLSIGTPANVREATRREADRRLDITRANAKRRAAASRARGRGLMAQSKTAVLRGFTKAAGIGASTLAAF